MKKILMITDVAVSIIASIYVLHSLWIFLGGLLTVFGLSMAINGNTFFLAIIHTIFYTGYGMPYGILSAFSTLLVLVYIFHLIINFPRNKYYAILIGFFVVISLTNNFHPFLFDSNLKLFDYFSHSNYWNYFNYATAIGFDFALIYICTRNLFLAKQIIYPT
ncbi:MAG: hypothetical protein Q7S04_02775 [Candidatus Moranbacteria bacterium]|nr:hypothetical protein [Candidatus Moranbacteria bacterium]